MAWQQRVGLTTATLILFHDGCVLHGHALCLVTAATPEVLRSPICSRVWTRVERHATGLMLRVDKGKALLCVHLSLRISILAEQNQVFIHALRWNLCHGLRAQNHIRWWNKTTSLEILRIWPIWDCVWLSLVRSLASLNTFLFTCELFDGVITFAGWLTEESLEWV